MPGKVTKKIQQLVEQFVIKHIDSPFDHQMLKVGPAGHNLPDYLYITHHGDAKPLTVSNTG